MRKTTQNLSDQQSWHERMPELQTILNSTISKSRGYSPFFLTFFKQPNFPFQKLADRQDSYNESSTLEARLNFANKTLNQANQHVIDAFQDSKREFDKRIRQSKIKPGDLVMVKTSQRGKIHRKKLIL